MREKNERVKKNRDNKRVMKHHVVLTVASLAILIIGLITLFNGYATSTNGAPILQEKGSGPSIQTGDLVTCCSFTNTDGKEKKCKVLKSYSCDYCDIYC